MGRHRTDPRGLARIAIAVAGILAALALLGIGAYALSGALSSEGVGSTAETQTGSGNQPAASPDLTKTLYVRVIGERSDLFVKQTGGDILVDETLQRGQYFTTDYSQLEVKIGTPAAVEVFENGKRLDLSKAKEDYSFVVSQRTTQ
ncbi:MAG: hypothetical protein GEV11_01685 [Streptosporangiales bacterium]|nr:hypothetical protein [Streptosporangiales bacterium]